MMDNNRKISKINNNVTNNEINTKEFKNFIGIDVAKYKFDIYNDINGKTETINNQKQFIEKYCDYLDKLLEEEKLNKEDLLVVIDLTGGYEKEIVSIFYAKGYINILLAEGLKVKNFSKSTKYNRAKTDKIDSFILAEYGKTLYKTLKLYKPMNKIREEVTIIYSRVEDLKEELQREKARLKSPIVKNKALLRESVERNIKNLKEEINEIEKYIVSILKKDKELSVIYDTLMKQDGIARGNALFLLIRVKELGRIERKQLTSICGLAPVPNDSGTQTGHRYIRGGRKEIRSKMFFCITGMIRNYPYMRSKINYRTKNEGKNAKVIMVAEARKKIVVINARVRDALKANNL